MYSNSNIYPKSEFEKRFSELKRWADSKNIPLIKDEYDPQEWVERVAPLGEAEPKTPEREARCATCYKLRLEHAAQYAIDNDFSHLSSTLAVSPYQYFEALKRTLQEVCSAYGLTPVSKDFRPFYREATKVSKELGMYRQKYCGCEFSLRESMAQFKKTGKQKYIDELKSIIESHPCYPEIKKAAEKSTAGAANRN